MLRRIFSVAIAAVLLAVSCSRPTEHSQSHIRNRENARIAKVLGPYFYNDEGPTNFLDMSKEEKQATISMLRAKANPESTLIFFEIGDSGEFLPLDPAADVETLLASHTLTPEEIRRVKYEAVEVAATPRGRMERGQRPRGRSLASGGRHILNSSHYDVYCAALGRWDNRQGQDQYHGVGCIVLSPTALR